MTDPTAARPSLSLRLGIILWLIPLTAALAGLIIRYTAYLAISGNGALADFVTGLCRWDCTWYVYLADGGYNPFPTPTFYDAGNWAFFPLYPLVVATIRDATGLSTLVAGTATSTLLSVASGRLAWELLGRNLRSYTLFSAFLLAGPLSIYFTTFYTEALFAFLTLCVFVALRRRRFLLAGLFSAGLSATRIVGVFIVFATLVEVWREHRERGGTWSNFLPAVLARPDILLGFALAPLGLFAFMAFLHFHLGDALAFQHVQRAWGRPFNLPPVSVWNALSGGADDQVLGLAALAGYAVTLLLALQGRLGMAAFALLCLTLPLFAGTTSMLRFVAGLVPIALCLCDLLGRRPVVFAIALLLLPAGAWCGTVGWITGYQPLV